MAITGSFPKEAQGGVGVRISVDNKTAIVSLKRVNTALENVERRARTARQEIRRTNAESRASSAQALRVRGQSFRRNILRTQNAAGTKAILTSEGLQAGVFKFTDTGFAIEGIAAKFIVVAASGRIIGGLSQGLVHTRDLIKKGVGVVEATLGVAANKTIDSIRSVTNAFGLEQTIVGLGALISGRTIESLKNQLDATANKVKRAFLPSLEKEADKILQKQLKDFKDRIELETFMSNEALFLPWHLSPEDLNDTRSEVKRLNRFYVAGQIRKQEADLKREQRLAATGAGY